MQLLADLIARHVLIVLLGVVAVMLVFTAAFWRLVDKFAPRLWPRAVQGWDAMRGTALARRFKNMPVLGAFLTRTLTVARYLGVFAVAAFALAAGATAVFVEIADEIGVGESLAAFDVALSDALRQHLSREILQAFSLITTLGDTQFLIALGALVAAILLAARRWLLAGAWIVAGVSGGLLNLLLKAIFERQRPIHEHGLVSETSWSFPSGHASGSMLIYGLLGYLIVRHTPRTWHIPVAAVAVALIVFVGSSRVLLQVHYLSDVLAGYASAAAWVALCIAGLEAARRRGADGRNPPA